MADGEPPATELNAAAGQQLPEPARAEPDPAAADPAAAYPAAGVGQPPGLPWPPPLAPRSPKAARKKIDWQAHFATWQTRLGNGLTHLGRALSHFGGWLTALGRWLVRLSEVRPSPLQTLAILGGFAVLSVFGALAFPRNAFGQACVIAFVPGLCVALGILGNRWYAKQSLDQHTARATQNAIHATAHLQRSVRYVDDRLSAAQSHLENGRNDTGLIEVVRAKTAAELSLGTAEQAARQWESVVGQMAAPVSGSTASARRNPAYRHDGGDHIAGSVARVEDQSTLIINRGSEHGIRPEMEFAVMADGGDEIVDPETGTVIGELPTEKLRVKIVEVQPKYARAVACRTFNPTRVEYPSLVGAFDSIDESINRMLESELAESLPVREKIADAKSPSLSGRSVQSEVTVNIGDPVLQVVAR